MKSCVQVCPENLRWKLFMLLGRYINLVGYRTLSRKVDSISFLMM